MHQYRDLGVVPPRSLSPHGPVQKQAIYIDFTPGPQGVTLLPGLRALSFALKGVQMKC